MSTEHRVCYLCAEPYVEVFPHYAPEVPRCIECSASNLTQDLFTAARAEAVSRYVCYFCAEVSRETLMWYRGEFRICKACLKERGLKT